MANTKVTSRVLADNAVLTANITDANITTAKIADNAVRNCGTLGGSICNADPAADYPAALLSLNATINTNSRKILAKDFFVHFQSGFTVSIAASTNVACTA